MKTDNFSLWCDFVERDFLSTEFKQLIENEAINGATSNPSIFKSAIISSSAYTKQKQDFKDKKGKDLYEILASTDIKIAANALLKNYAKDNDGFISIEVDPRFANDEFNSVKEGKEIAGMIKMPNVMIKIPATHEGFKAMKTLLAEGYNINATLIFSPTQTQNCLEAFKQANDEFKKRFPNSPLPKAVISIFVSRFDSLLDSKLSEFGMKEFEIGINNATKCYKIIENENLPNVRALFASTGTKSDKIPKDYYIKELEFENSINTAPLEAIKAFIQNKKQMKEPKSDEFIKDYFNQLQKNGIDMQEIYDKLLNDGLKQFEVAFSELLNSL